MSQYFKYNFEGAILHQLVSYGKVLFNKLIFISIYVIAFLLCFHNQSQVSALDSSDKPVLVTSEFCPNMNCDFLIEEDVEYLIPRKLTVNESKSTDSITLGIVQPGEIVKLLSSQLDLVPGKVIVTTTVPGGLINPTPYAGDVTVNKGDVLSLYRSLSEGVSEVKFKGRIYHAQVSRTRDYCKKIDDIYSCWVDVLVETVFNEWLKVKLPTRNIEGWVLVGSHKEGEWNGKILTPVVAKGPQKLNLAKLGEVIKTPGKYTVLSSRCKIEIQKFGLVEGADQLVLINPNNRLNQKIAYITAMGWISKNEIVFSASSYSGVSAIYSYSCLSETKQRIYPEIISEEQEALAGDSREYYVLERLSANPRKAMFYLFPDRYHINILGPKLYEVNIK